jgi:GT2 family glycosyltransferase
MSKPFFSILILFWQSEPYLQRCLQSLQAQTFQDFEVILLDNGASQPPDPEVLATFQDLALKHIHSETNLGFAGGNNLAARSASGEYLVLLNGDAFPEPDWLATLHQAALVHPGHCFASRLLRADHPEILDGEWNVYHASGLALRKNHNQPAAKSATSPRLVMSACAAASAYPRSAFEQVGGFDEEFFAYMEDLDLDMRLQLAGYPFLYLPDATVRHVGSGSTSYRSDFATYYGHRNLIWAFVKNMPGFLFCLLLPAHIFYNLLYLLAGFFIPSGKALFRGKRDALRGLSVMLKKRRAIQTQRKITPCHFARLLDWNPFSPLVKILTRNPSTKDQND